MIIILSLSLYHHGIYHGHHIVVVVSLLMLAGNAGGEVMVVALSTQVVGRQVIIALLMQLHQEKPTVPFITIDHYRSLFVTFVAISAIIALWHP